VLARSYMNEGYEYWGVNLLTLSDDLAFLVDLQLENERDAAS
jgi:hypothetical protein